MARKTIEVDAVVNFVNDYLKLSPASCKGERLGMMIMMEHILHLSGKYKGFRYLLAEEVKDGVPGINYKDGVPDLDVTARFANTDRTRVQF